MAFLLLLKEANALPGWLEGAPDSAEVEKLPSVAFADTHRRLMPIHTKSAAFLSAVSSCVYDYPSEGSWEDRVKAACQSYGIIEHVKAAHEALASHTYHKEAAVETKKRAYALELEVEPGRGPVSYYPINNQDEVEDSALKMARDYQEQKLPGTWFVEAAEALIKAASEFEVRPHLIPDCIHQLAESRMASPEYLEEQIERRVKYAGISEAAVAIYKEAAAGCLSGDYPAMDAAHVWELADRQLGVRYNAVVVPPLSAFRSGMTKANFEKVAGSVISVADVMVPFNQLTTMSEGLIATVLPRKIAAVVLQARDQPDGLKAASILQILDNDEQLQLLSLLANDA